MTDGLFIRQVAFELLTLDTFWKFTRFIQISNNFNERILWIRWLVLLFILFHRFLPCFMKKIIEHSNLGRNFVYYSSVNFE